MENGKWIVDNEKLGFRYGATVVLLQSATPPTSTTRQSLLDNSPLSIIHYPLSIVIDMVPIDLQSVNWHTGGHALSAIRKNGTSNARVFLWGHALSAQVG